jgi:hypothetical protein
VHVALLLGIELHVLNRWLRVSQSSLGEKWERENEGSLHCYDSRESV